MATTTSRGRSVRVLAALGIVGVTVGAGGAKGWTPAPEPRVIESGATPVQLAGTGERVLSWGAVVGNPRGKAAVGTYLDVEVLDRDGHVVATQDAFISVIPPGGSTGVAGEVWHPDDGIEVRVKVDGVASWRSADDDLLGELRVDDVDVAYGHADQPLITFKVTSTYRQAVTPFADLIYRDAHGHIVGGERGTRFEPSEADPSATAEVSGRYRVPQLARVDVYVTPSEDAFPDDR